LRHKIGEQMGRIQLRDSDSRWPGLTDLERSCAEEYLKDLNQTQAFMRAGGTVTVNDNPGQRAQLIFNRPRVRAYLKHLIEERNKRVRVDAQYVLEELVDLYKEVRRGDLQELRLAKDTLLLIGKHVDVSAFEEKVSHGIAQDVAPSQAVFIGVGTQQGQASAQGFEEALEGEFEPGGVL
jgi:hypothetical protein